MVITALIPDVSHARLLAFLKAKHRARTEPVATVGHPIAPGETFFAILSRYGVAKDEVQSVYDAARPETDLRRLAAGSVLSLNFAADQHFVGLQYEVDDEKRLVVERAGLGFRARLEGLPYEVRVVGARGRIERSFYRAAHRSGVPDPVISQLVDLLGWKLDFGSEVRVGDRFRVLYEERVAPDGRVRAGRVLAADFNGRVGTATAFLYQNDRGESGYLDAEGRSLEGGLLRYPVEFTRITSSFSRSRFHPILKRHRPHLGVDFAAPIGTPVRAVGSGKVRWAARKGGFGRHVEIDHGGGMISTYSHLNGIHPAIRAGRRVERGQLIGWVGKSGLATGPHLHFAIFEDGRYVNPLKVHRAPQIRSVDPKEFERIRVERLEQLRLVGAGELRATPSTPPVVLSSLAQARRLGPVGFTL